MLCVICQMELCMWLEDHDCPYGQRLLLIDHDIIKIRLIIVSIKYIFFIVMDMLFLLYINATKLCILYDFDHFMNLLIIIILFVQLTYYC